MRDIPSPFVIYLTYIRSRSGAVAAPDAMLATNGRTYHGYNPGCMFLNLPYA